MASCTINNKDNNLTDKALCSNDFKIIHIDDIIGIQNPDSIINSYYYVPLQTTENCLIGKVDKIMFSKDRIYILDQMTKSIFVYEMNGVFVYKINKFGRGPAEYDNIMDFDIDSTNNQIIALCTNFRKLIFYDAESGHFIKEHKLEFSPLSFMKTGQNSYLFDCKIKLNQYMGNNILIVTDTLYNIQNGYFPRNNNISIEPTPFSRFSNNIYYCSNYNDTIYKYQNDTLYKKYYVDFGDRKLDLTSLPEELYTAKGVLGSKIISFLSYDKFSKYMSTKDIAYQITSILETDSFVRFQFIYKGMVYNALFDKTTQKVKTYLGLRQNKEICIDFIKTAYKNSFVGVVNSDILIDVLTTYKKKSFKNYEDIRKKARLPDTISKNDNPVLIFVNYKSF
jgi:hypothetical protein